MSPVLDWRRWWSNRYSRSCELTQQGMTLFLVEQNAHHALKLSDRAYVMVNGQIQLSGTGRELLNNPEVRNAYLGVA